MRQKGRESKGEKKRERNETETFMRQNGPLGGNNRRGILDRKQKEKGNDSLVYKE